jgi:Zn-dependent peptidase ImmA (M78 family)
MPYLNNEPEDYARLLLSELDIARVSNLDDLLTPLRLKVKEVDALDFEGALVCRKNREKGIIALKRGIKEEGRKRFTVCHEIGHFILPGHGTSNCKSSGIESWNFGLSAQEIEANRFASELLLPTKEIYQTVHDKKVTLSLVKQLSLDFNASLTAAALKSIEVSSEACAVIWSTNGFVKWFKKNENFRYFIQYGRLDEQSLALKLFQNNNLREDENFVYSETWLRGDNLSSKLMIWEDSIYLPNYNSVLTMLTIET